VQTLEDSSFDSWIKFYQPNENSVNSMVSYYLKGSMAALALDLSIMRDSSGEQSLSDVMQVLWQQYGKTGLGLPENHFERVTFEVTGADYSDLFDLMLRTTEELPLTELLLGAGVILKRKEAKVLDSTGLKLIESNNQLKIRSVLSDTVAEQAGLAANDTIVAMNNFAVKLSNIEELCQRYQSGETIKVHILRDQYLYDLEMKSPDNLNASCELELISDVSGQQKLYRNKWLG